MGTATTTNEVTIRDVKTAAFLINPTNAEHLAPFMTGDKTLSEAAAELGISKSLMSYWLKKLERFGLVRTVRTEKQGRHKVAVYAACADAFIVPLDLVITDPNKDPFDALPFERALKRSQIHFKHENLRGRFIRLAKEDDNVVLDVVPRQTRKLALADHWGRVNLTRAQAHRFYQEIDELFGRIVKDAKSSGGRKYMFKLVLVEQWPQ